jgi:hypothetical protein
MNTIGLIIKFTTKKCLLKNEIAILNIEPVGITYSGATQNFSE